MAKMKLKKEVKPKKEENFFQSIINTIKILPQAILFVMIINGIAIASFVVPTGSMENEVMTGDFLFVNKFKYGPTTPQVIPILNIPLPYYKFPGFWEPEKEDVIVFVYPGDRDEVEASQFQYYLKRCIATAGDTLHIKDKVVYVNGVRYPLPENGKFMPNYGDRMAGFPYGTSWTLNNYGPIYIPKKGDKIKVDLDNIRQWDTFIRREGHEITIDRHSVFVDGKAIKEYEVERDYCFGMGDNRDNSEDSRSWGFIPYENVVGTPIVVYWSWDTNMPISDIFSKLASTRFNRIGTFID